LIATWIKLLAAVMILVWASVFHASNLEARKALSVATNKADDEFAIGLPKGWTTKRDVMGNQLLSEFEKPLEGQRPVKALLMFSNQGLKQGHNRPLKHLLLFVANRFAITPVNAWITDCP